MVASVAAASSVVSLAGTTAAGRAPARQPVLHGPIGEPAPVTATQGTVPPNNPPQNIPPNPNFLSSCSGSRFDNSPGCVNAVLQAIANARAQEGLGGMGLPPNWYSLSAQQQMFVATNLERSARGLPTLSAAATALDNSSAQAAQTSQDPSPPAGFPWSSWGGNWAGAVGNPLEAMYYWMYDDGEGSNNVACTPSNSSGCWGHRDNVLMPLRCQPCVMGTGYAAGGYQGYPSWTELLVDTSGSPQLDYTYAQLMNGSATAPANPLSGSPTSAPSIAIGPNGLPTVAVQGPGNNVWIYWQGSNAQWYGPLGIGQGMSAPSIAIGPNGLPTVAVQGPGNSVWIYWQASNAQWYGPLGIGQGSSPSVAVGPDGLPTVAVQGPGNNVWIYWQAGDASWHGPLGVGPGSSPSVAVGPNGLPTVAVQGPSNMMWVYWQAGDASWHGPLAVGEGTSAPSVAIGPNGLPTVAVDGPYNSVWIYWQASNAQWYGPLGVGQGTSAPSIAIGPNGLPTVAVEGPGSTLWIYWQAGNANWYGPLGVGGGGSTLAVPSIAVGPSGLPTIAVQGPGTQWIYWQAGDANWYGPLGMST